MEALKNIKLSFLNGCEPALVYLCISALKYLAIIYIIFTNRTMTEMNSKTNKRQNTILFELVFIAFFTCFFAFGVGLCTWVILFLCKYNHKLWSWLLTILFTGGFVAYVYSGKFTTLVKQNKSGNMGKFSKLLHNALYNIDDTKDTN